jgi:phage-related protein
VAFNLEIIVKLRNEAQKALGDLNTGLVGLGKGAAAAAVGGIAAIGAGLINIGDQASNARTVLQGLNDVDLTAVLDDAQLLARRYGTDVTSVVAATRTLMDEFGLTSAEATDVIASGFARGLDSSGDLLDSIGEYSNLFADNGASATEFFSMLESGMAGGVLGTDKAADAFKEFGIRLSELTTGEGDVVLKPVIGGEPGQMAERFVSDLEDALYFTDLTDEVKVNLYEGLQSGAIDTADAFKIIMPALAGIESEVERNAAGVKLFGTQWEDLGPEAMTALTMAGDSLSTLGDVADTERATIQSLGEVPAMIFDKFSLALLPVSDLILGVVNAVMSAEDPLATLIDKVVELIPGFEQFAGQGAEISRQLQPFIQLVKDNLVPIVIALAAVIGVALVAAFVAIAAPIAKIVLVTSLFVAGLFAAVMAAQKFWQEISTRFPQVQAVVDMAMIEVQATIQTVMHGISVIVSETLKALQEFWADNGDGIMKTVVAAFGVIGKLFQNAMQMIRAVVDTALALIRGDWTAFSDGLKKITNLFVKGQELGFKLLWTIVGPIINVIKNGIIGGLSAAWNGIKPHLDSIRTGIINALTNAWNGITGNLANIKNGIVNAINDAWNGITGYLANIKNGIVNAINNAWNGITGYLANIRDRITSTIRDAWNGITGNLANIKNGIVSAINDAWNGITGYLANIKNGIVNAINDAWNGIVGYLANIKNGIVNAINDAWNGITGNLANIKNGIVNAINDAWNGITGYLANIRDRITSTIRDAWNGITGNLANIRNGIINAINDAWNGITGYLANIRDRITSTIRDAWNNITGNLANIRNGIINAIKDAVTGIATPLTSIKDKISDAMESAKTYLKNTFSWGDTAAKLGEALMNAIGKAIRNGVTAMAEALKDVLRAALKSLPKPIRDALELVGIKLPKIAPKSAPVPPSLPVPTSRGVTATMSPLAPTSRSEPAIVVNINVGSVRDQRDIDAIERAVTRGMSEAARRGIVQSQLPRGI